MAVVGTQVLVNLALIDGENANRHGNGCLPPGETASTNEPLLFENKGLVLQVYCSCIFEQLIRSQSVTTTLVPTEHMDMVHI